jgi:hypothetical protein
MGTTLNGFTAATDSPVLLIAAIVLVGLLVFGIARKLMRLVLVASGLGVVVVGLFFARSAGLIDW